MKMHSILLFAMLGLGAVDCLGFWGYRHQGPMKCLSPRFHGLVLTPSKSLYEDGETVEISCEEGYEMKNRQTNSTCMVSHDFGGVFMPAISHVTCKELPLCRPPIGPGLIVEPMKSLYEKGENITVSCEEGFVQLGGESTFTCRTTFRRYGRTSFGVSGRRICKEISDCSPPVQSGLLIAPLQMRYKPGEEISLSCEEDYELVVSNTSICEPTGHFNFERLESKHDDEWQGVFSKRACRFKAKCKLDDVTFEGLTVTPNKPTYERGEEITISCEEGYELTSPNKSVCSLRPYRGRPFYYMPYFINPISTMGQFQPIVGSRTCMPEPKCYLPHERGVVITPQKMSYELGETVEVSCMEGYELVDNSTRTCRRRTELGERYRRMGFSHRYSHGHFLPELDDVCKRKTMCRYPMSRGVMLTPTKTLYDVGEKISVSCKPGYELKGTEETTCQSQKSGWRYRYFGTFSPEIGHDVCEKIPSCEVPIYEGLIVSPEKDYYAIGDQVSLSCEEGYEQRVAPMSTCMRDRSGKDGSFDPEIDREPCRKPTSCQAPQADNLTVLPMKDKYEEGEEITLSCPEGFRRNVPKIMTCERSYYCRGHPERVTGCFHPPASRIACIEKQKCRMPKDDKLILTPQKEEYIEGDEVTISCIEGYELRLPYDTATCDIISRLWSFGYHDVLSARFRPYIPRGACKKKLSCALPESTNGVVLTPEKDEYYVGDRITISCEEGYELVGKSTSKCIAKNGFIFPGMVANRRAKFKPAVEKSSCRKIKPEVTEEGPSEPEIEIGPDLETTGTESPDVEASGIEDDIIAEETEPTPAATVNTETSETQPVEGISLEEKPVERA